MFNFILNRNIWILFLNSKLSFEVIWATLTHSPWQLQEYLVEFTYSWQGITAVQHVALRKWWGNVTWQKCEYVSFGVKLIISNLWFWILDSFIRIHHIGHLIYTFWNAPYLNKLEDSNVYFTLFNRITSIYLSSFSLSRRHVSVFQF